MRHTVTFEVHGMEQVELEAAAERVLARFVSLGWEVDYSLDVDSAEVIPPTVDTKGTDPILWRATVHASVTPKDTRGGGEE